MVTNSSFWRVNCGPTWNFQKRFKMSAQFY